MELKFIDAPPPGPADRKWGLVRKELRANPGQWAEVKRAPKAERREIYQACAGLANRFEDIEAVTRIVGEDCILYARAVAS